MTSLKSGNRKRQATKTSDYCVHETLLQNITEFITKYYHKSTFSAITCKTYPQNLHYLHYACD